MTTTLVEDSTPLRRLGRQLATTTRRLTGRPSRTVERAPLRGLKGYAGWDGIDLPASRRRHRAPIAEYDTVG